MAWDVTQVLLHYLLPSAVAIYQRQRRRGLRNDSLLDVQLKDKKRLENLSHHASQFVCVCSCALSA